MEEMTVQQYAKIRGVSSVAVTRALNKNQKIVGVHSYRKVGRDWLLMVFPKEAEKKPKNYLVISE